MITINRIERIIAEHAHKSKVIVGEEVSVDVDLAIAHDVTAPIATDVFRKIGAKKVFDNKKVAFVADHNIPPSTVNSRKQHKTLRRFANDYNTCFYGNGEGVIHQLVYEEKLYKRGDIIVGADSHTCTAGAHGAVAIGVGSTELAAVMALGQIDIEVPPVSLIRISGARRKYVYGKDIILHIIGKFGTNYFTDRGVIVEGDTIRALSSDDKMTIANMMIEMGTMIGIVSDETEDIDSVEEVLDIDADDIVPCVACPPSPGNVKPVSEIKDVVITQAVLGSCTNGRYSDMKIAAEVLRGKKVAPDVVFVVAPSSKRVAEKMDETGLTKIFRDAGAIVVNPGCGPCFGAHQGILDFDDVAISSTNRNFPGRMGHKQAQIYLASPRIVAESVVVGKITAPGTVCQDD